MKLGELIDILSSLPGDWDVVTQAGTPPGDIASYRGYYDHLAIDPVSSARSMRLSDFVSDLKNTIGRKFDGYKGGEYVASADTPMWLSGWGDSSGISITGVHIARNRAILAGSYIDYY